MTNGIRMSLSGAKYDRRLVFIQDEINRRLAKNKLNKHQ